MPTKVKLDPFLPGYGREGELAVDREGAKLAMQAGYSAEAAVRLLQDLCHPGRPHADSPEEAKESLERRIAQITAVSAESKLPKPGSEKPLALP